MEELKKNLHLVVFGAGVLLGIILLVVGITMRGGTEDTLDASLATLQTVSPVTEGDLTEAKQTRERFDASLASATSTLERRGKSLEQGFNPAINPGNFYTDDATQTLRRLQADFNELRREQTLPEPLAGRYRIADTTRANEFWTERDKEMSSLRQDQVRDYWIRLRIMEEVAAVCQDLVEAGADDGMGVRLINFTFENIAPIGTQEDLSPWMTMPWGVQIECSPSFGVMLLSELTSPTEASMENRRGFPNLFSAYQMQLKERPDRGKFLIDNEYKKELGHSEDLGPNDARGQQVIEEVKKKIEDEITIAQPARVALRLRAAMFNERWRPVVEPEEQ